MPTKKQVPPKQAAQVIRNRIKELRMVPAAELRTNDRNWRLHPYAQKRAIAESLERVGIADALLGYESERNKGALTLIDGHARLEEEVAAEWPVLILDVNDEEADFLLLTLDPMTAMAETDPAQLGRLLADMEAPGTPALEDLLAQIERGDVGEGDQDDDPLAELEWGGPPEMALQAFEHYDYVMLLFRNALDWSRAKDLFEIGEVAFTLRDGVTRKIGVGRVVDGVKLFELIERERAAAAEQAAKQKR